MSYIFGTEANFNSNEAKKFRIENNLSFPIVGASDSGRIILNTGLNGFYGWNGSSWINFAGGGGSYILPTASDTILGGVRIDGDTIAIDGSGVLNVVSTYQPSGFETINDGNGDAWRWIGEIAGDDITRYKAGAGAIDGMVYNGSTLGNPDVPSLPFGTKSAGGINFGVDNKDAAQFNSIIFGGVNQTSAYANSVLIGTFNNAGYGYGDTLIGTYNTTSPYNVNSFLTAIGHNVTMTGGLGGVGLGLALVHNSRGAVMVGTSNVPWTGSPTASDRPAFQVGIGTTTTPQGRWMPSIQKNGFTVSFNGTVVTESLTTALINAEVTGKVLTTKEWVLPKYEVNASVTATQNIDWQKDTFRFTMTGNTTFSDINLPTDGVNTKRITIYIDGNFTPTWPAGWTTNVTGLYNGAVLNKIVVEFISTGLYWVDIHQAD